MAVAGGRHVGVEAEIQHPRPSAAVGRHLIGHALCRGQSTGSWCGLLFEPTEPEEFPEIAKLRRRQCSRPFDQVFPVQGDQPRAGDEPGAGERDPQHAFHGQSLRGTYCQLGGDSAEFDAGGSDDLHRPELRPFSREQYDGPPPVDLRPPDFATLHRSSCHRAVDGLCEASPFDGLGAPTVPWPDAHQVITR
ncbi:hypothetical protein Spa2297_25905 [Streptomyces parvulus]|uniref:Uncharacterized protein n=1 Tax=Streptomyces parvulus TaxID=146923 RepID=A0A191V514_9ACTN|nr:hypothetical protein Spa2297_25905 [Streptomyces parvulus]